MLDTLKYIGVYNNKKIDSYRYRVYKKVYERLPSETLLRLLCGGTETFNDLYLHIMHKCNLIMGIIIGV
jgi:hypothetical protein